MMDHKEEKALRERYGDLLFNTMEKARMDKHGYEEEGETRYGDLLEKGRASSDRRYEEMLGAANSIIDYRLQHDEARLRDRIQERIEQVQRDEEKRAAKNKAFAESIMARKQAKIDAEEKERADRRRAEEKEQQLYDRIDRAMQISPKLAEEYVQILSKYGLI